MKTLALFALLTVLGLTACTDQPVEPEPTPTTTVTETVTADPAEQLPSETELTEAIATVTGASDPEALPQGATALEELTAALTPEGAEDDRADDAQEPDQCPTVFETQPEVAGYGLVEAQNEDTEEDPQDQEDTPALAALGFASPEDATALTDEVLDFVEACAGYDIQPLTHHTDEAFQIRIAPDDEPSTSVVLVRNTAWVYAVVSTPGTDVGLALTLIDQLEETLR